MSAPRFRKRLIGALLALMVIDPLAHGQEESREIPVPPLRWSNTRAVAKTLGLRPPRNGGVYVVAHRGAHRGIPENTLAAYQAAIDMGVDFVEVDIRTTKDGKFVSIHNDSVEAYVDGVSGKVKDFTLRELRALDIGIRHGQQWKGTQVPTFEEILDLCQGRCGIYLDLKEASVSPLVEIITKRGMQRDVLWYANDNKLQEVRRRCPTCITMPDPGPMSRLPRMLRQSKPAVVAAVWRFYSKDFVQMCHRAGAMVIVDERDSSCWDEAIAWGSDGIQTDDPGGLLKRLRSDRRGVKSSPDERLRSMVMGVWTDNYHGKRVMTLNEDGTGTIVVQLRGLMAAWYAARLRFDITWHIQDGRFIKQTTGGEPAGKVALILKAMGDRAEEPIQKLTRDRLILLDQNGKTTYHWVRVP